MSERTTIALGIGASVVLLTIFIVLTWSTPR